MRSLDVQIGDLIVQPGFSIFEITDLIAEIGNSSDQIANSSDQIHDLNKCIANFTAWPGDFNGEIGNLLVKLPI